MHRFAEWHKKAIIHASRNLTDAEKKHGQIEKWVSPNLCRAEVAALPSRTTFRSSQRSQASSCYTGARKDIQHTALTDFCTCPLSYAGTVLEFSEADALSWLIAEQTTPTNDAVIAQAVREAEVDCRAIRSTLTVDMKTITEGRVACYFALRQSLAIQDDCLLFSPRIVIPSKLRRRVLQL